MVEQAEGQECTEPALWGRAVVQACGVPACDAGRGQGGGLPGESGANPGGLAAVGIGHGESFAPPGRLDHHAVCVMAVSMRSGCPTPSVGTDERPGQLRHTVRAFADRNDYKLPCPAETALSPLPAPHELGSVSGCSGRCDQCGGYLPWLLPETCVSRTSERRLRWTDARWAGSVLPATLRRWPVFFSATTWSAYAAEQARKYKSFRS